MSLLLNRNYYVEETKKYYLEKIKQLEASIARREKIIRNQIDYNRLDMDRIKKYEFKIKRFDAK